MDKVEIYNTGNRPVQIGRDKNRHPLVIHPKKSLVVNSVLAAKLIKNYDSIINYVGDKPVKSGSKQFPGKTGKVISK